MATNNSVELELAMTNDTAQRIENKRLLLDEAYRKQIESLSDRFRGGEDGQAGTKNAKSHNTQETDAVAQLLKLIRRKREVEKKIMEHAGGLMKDVTKFQGELLAVIEGRGSDVAKALEGMEKEGVVKGEGEMDVEAEGSKQEGLAEGRGVVREIGGDGKQGVVTRKSGR